MGILIGLRRRRGRWHCRKYLHRLTGRDSPCRRLQQGCLSFGLLGRGWAPSSVVVASLAAVSSLAALGTGLRCCSGWGTPRCPLMFTFKPSRFSRTGGASLKLCCKASPLPLLRPLLPVPSLGFRLCSPLRFRLCSCAVSLSAASSPLSFASVSLRVSPLHSGGWFPVTATPVAFFPLG